MSKNGANFLLNLSYDDLSSGLPAIGVKYDDETMTVVNPLNDEELLSKLDIIHQMYQEGIINGDAPTADDSSKYATFFAAQAGVALQRQHGDQTMVLKTVQQFSTAILLYPIQLFVVLSMVSTQDVSIQIRHLSC